VAGKIELFDEHGEVVAASTTQWMGPSQWHRVEVDVSSKGVDALRLQGTTILQDVALANIGGDLRLLASHAPAGFADIRLKPIEPDAPAGTAVFQSKGSLQGDIDVGWDNGTLFVSGGTGEVVSDTLLPPQCTIEMDVRFEHIGLGWVDLGGTRVLIGESPNGGPTTGSIVGRDEVHAGLVADKTWARVSIELAPHVAQRYMTVRVGGLAVAKAIVPGDSVSGPLAIGHQVETGWVSIRNVTLVVD
jgi:hypothetical protein